MFDWLGSTYKGHIFIFHTSVNISLAIKVMINFYFNVLSPSKTDIRVKIYNNCHHQQTFD